MSADFSVGLQGMCSICNWSREKRFVLSCTVAFMSPQLLNRAVCVNVHTAHEQLSTLRVLAAWYYLGEWRKGRVWQYDISHFIAPALICWKVIVININKSGHGAEDRRPPLTLTHCWSFLVYHHFDGEVNTALFLFFILWNALLKLLKSSDADQQCETELI